MQLSKKEGQVQKLETELRRKLKQIEGTVFQVFNSVSILG